MDRRGFLKGLIVAPVTAGIVGAVNIPAVKQTVVEVPTKPAHLMAIFTAEVDSQKARNLYGKSVVLVDKVRFDTNSVQIELDPHQPFSSGESDIFYHILPTMAYLQVKIKEPGKKAQVFMSELRFDSNGMKYYFPMWIKKGSKVTVRVKDNRKFIGGYTCRILLTGGEE